jgi:MbtH protein
MDESDDTREYVVVKNAEEQHSILLAHKEIPAGWTAEGTRGTKAECLARIETVWPDITPLSVRRALGRETETNDDGD